jgi:hypothetical protein
MGTDDILQQSWHDSFRHVNITQLPNPFVVTGIRQTSNLWRIVIRGTKVSLPLLDLRLLLARVGSVLSSGINVQGFPST